MLEIHATRKEIEAHFNQFEPAEPRYPAAKAYPRLEDCLRVFRNPYEEPYKAADFIGQAIVNLPNGDRFRWHEKIDDMQNPDTSSVEVYGYDHKLSKFLAGINPVGTTEIPIPEGIMNQVDITLPNGYQFRFFRKLLVAED